MLGGFGMPFIVVVGGFGLGIADDFGGEGGIGGGGAGGIGGGLMPIGRFFGAFIIPGGGVL